MDRRSRCTATSVYAAWMSGHTGQNRVYVAHSPLTKLEFSRLRARFAGGRRAGTSQARFRWQRQASCGLGRVAGHGTGGACHQTGQPAADRSHKHGHGPDLSGIGRAIMVAELGADGRFEGARPVAPRTGAFQLNPAVTIDEDGTALIAWNELDSTGKRVVFVRGVPESRSQP